MISFHGQRKTALSRNVAMGSKSYSQSRMKSSGSSKERLHFSCVYHAGNGDHVEGTSCGSKSKDDDVCLHWETHVVEWEVARKKIAIFKVKIAFFLVLYIQASATAWRSLGFTCCVVATVSCIHCHCSRSVHRPGWLSTKTGQLSGALSAILTVS